MIKWIAPVRQPITKHDKPLMIKLIRTLSPEINRIVDSRRDIVYVTRGWHKYPYPNEKLWHFNIRLPDNPVEIHVHLLYYIDELGRQVVYGSAT